MLLPDTFFYGAHAIEHLKKRDPVLGAAIDLIGPIERPVNPDVFTALVHSIVGQQISTKAHDTIWQRMVDAFSPICPQSLASAPVEALQSCGITMRKAGYLKGLAQDVLDGTLDLAALAFLDDDEVCRRLVSVKGVGTWTAEMLLIFSLQRPDVLSWGDLAVQRGLRMLYRHRKITPTLFAKYRRRYTPHGSVASLYLWAIASGRYPIWSDPAARKART
ncbi:MAG: DNA-3-methyladenine glycosylase [Bifidobacteriaceae bacterium]|nr:DNA-3-methyladenine glycosylase [Bifidobacteriaceae bacterium]